MKCKNLILIASALLLTTGPAAARQLSEEEARAAAMSFIGSNDSKFMKAPGKNHELKVAYKAGRKSENAFYVFDRGSDSGFLIVSADDRLPQILGYSSAGSFDYDNAPENLKWWLGQYEEEIFNYYAQENVISPMKSVQQREADSKAVIPALVSTQWNQDAPYNDKCPTDAGGRSVTGCAATALAQIINYHKYPATNGTGTYSYSWNGQTLIYDYANANFDWANMLDSYDSSSSAESRAAVANLMLACGVGLHMNYSSGESGASDLAVPRLLVENMNYDGSVTIVRRSDYSLKDWQDLIYKELSEKRPVFYTGQANTGGHAFVCDGYSGEGYFHINWGWGGHSDGDFLLSALNPSDQGIGSYQGGYNSKQTAVINIMKNQGNGRKAILITDTGFVYNNRFEIGSVFNYSTYTVSATFGIEIVAENESAAPVYAEGVKHTIDGANLDTGRIPGIGFSFSATPKNLVPGKYRCYLAYKTDDTPWERLRSPYGEQQYVELTVGEDGSLTYANPGPEVTYDLTVTSFSVNGKIYSDTESTCSIIVKNNADADYNNIIRMDVSANGEVVKSEKHRIEIAANQSFKGGFSSTFNLQPGNYDVNFYDATDKLINTKPFIITVEEGSAPVLPSGLIVKGLSSDIFYEGYSSRLTLVLFNNSSSEVPVTRFTLNILDNAGKKIDSYTLGGYTFKANSTLNYGVNGFYISAKAGKYYLEVLADDKTMGEPVAMYNAGKAEGIWYTLTEDATHARLVRAPVASAVENGIFDVPAKVSLAGADYEVSAVENDAFANYSGITTVFLRPENAPAKIAAAAAVLPSETVFYVENYDKYMPELGEDIYAILKSIALSESVSAMSLNVGDDFQFDVIYTPAEHINHEITISSEPADMFSFTQDTFANGKKTVKVKTLAAGSGTIKVTSAQPGTPVENELEVGGISTGIDRITADGEVTISTSGNTIIICGLAKGYAANVFNAAGQLVASRISDGETLYIDMPATGLYIVSAGKTGRKVSL